MMNETQLIKKFKTLKTIEPRRSWVLTDKASILGEDKKAEIFPFFKPVYAGLFCLLLLAGLFEFSQDSLPGDYLYSLKRVLERSQMVFSSEEEKPRVNLEQVNKRLEELSQIVKGNEVSKLAPALKEYQASISQATKNLTKAMTTTSDPVVLKEIAEQTKIIEQNKEELTKVYGIVGLEDNETTNLAKVVVERLIKDVGETSLTEEQQLLFEEAKEYFEQGNYSEALVKILETTNGK